MPFFPLSDPLCIRMTSADGNNPKIFTARTKRSRKIVDGTRSRDESFGTDFTNKCRRLNVGMSQDGSLSLNHRLPAAFLPPRPASVLVFASALPVRPSFSCSTFSLQALPPPRTKRPERKTEKRLLGVGSTGNLPHAYVAASLSPLQTTLCQRQPNRPRFLKLHGRRSIQDRTRSRWSLTRFPLITERRFVLEKLAYTSSKSGCSSRRVVLVARCNRFSRKCSELERPIKRLLNSSRILKALRSKEFSKRTNKSFEGL